jgi:hypothetical protein
MGRERVAAGLVAVVVAAGLLVSGGSRADPRTPPGLPGEPPPFLGTAVVGSGGLTAAIDAYGDVVDLRAPGPGGRALIDNPAARQAAGTVAAGTGLVPWVRIGAAPARPFWRANRVRQRYRPGTNVLVTEARFGSARIRIVYAAGDHGLACLAKTHGPARLEFRSREHAAARWLHCHPDTAQRQIRAAMREDRRWLRGGRPLGPGAPPWAEGLYERSLLVLHALTDRRSGAVVAGARDGWAYAWPRDAAAATLAFAAAGYRRQARLSALFLLGLDLRSAARFDGDGDPVPGRGPQGDAAGWVAAAARAVGLPPPPPLPWRNLPDYQEGEPGDYLGNAIAAATDEPKPSRRLVRRLGDPISGWDSAAAWAVEPFRLRALFPAARETMLRGVARAGGRFGILPSEDWSGGSDPWTAPTAWTAWSLAALGREGAGSRQATAERRLALRLLGDLRRAATPAGTIPERVGFRTGIPASTTPLAWSHAFTVLALRELWPERAASDFRPGSKGGFDGLRGRLDGDHPRAAGHPLAAGQLPAAEGNDLVADDAGEADLRKRPPLAADRDHRLAGCDDGEVAGVADAGGDDAGAIGVGVVGGDARDDPDHLAARLGSSARGRLHHATPAAADDGDARLRQPPSDFLGQRPELRSLLDAAAPDHRDLSPSPVPFNRHTAERNRSMRRLTTPPASGPSAPGRRPCAAVR